MVPTIKVALPGYEAEDATPEQCAVHSGFNMPKVDATKEHFVIFPIFFARETPDPGAGTSNETTIFIFQHSYSYIPQVWLHVDYVQSQGGVLTSQFGPGEAYLGSVTALDATYLRVKVERNYCKFVVAKTASGFGDVLHVQGMRLQARLYVFADTAFE